MLSLEEMSEKIEEIAKTADSTHEQVKSMMEIKTKDHPLRTAQNNHDDDDHKGKKGDNNDDDHQATHNDDDDHMGQNDEEKKEARANRYKAVKLAMEMDDEEKRDAAIKSAMEQTDPTTNTTPNAKESKKGQTEEEKEEHANVASIINDKRTEFITKILSANKIFNASNVESVEKRLRKASLTKLKQEYKVIKPFISLKGTPL